MKANLRFSQLLSPSFFTLLLVIACGGTEFSSKPEKPVWQAIDLQGHWDSGCLNLEGTIMRSVLSLGISSYTEVYCHYPSLGDCEAKSKGEGGLRSSSFYIYPQELKAESLSRGTPITSMPGSYFIGEVDLDYDIYFWGSSTSKNSMFWVESADNYLYTEEVDTKKVDFEGLISGSSTNQFLTKDWSQTSENSADAIFLQRIDLEKEGLELRDLGCSPRPDIIEV